MTIERCVRLIVTILVAIGILLGPFTLAVQAGGNGSGQDPAWEKLSPDLRSMLASNKHGTVPVIVQMDATDSTAALQVGDKPEHKAKGALEKHGGAATESLGIVRGASGRISIDRLSVLSREPGVRYITRDVLLTPAGSPFISDMVDSTTRMAGRQKSPKGDGGSPFSGDMVDFTRAVNAEAVWDKGVDGSGVTVAVIDSGVEPLPHGVDPNRLVASIDLVKGSRKLDDPGGHGTHVAGIIAGQGDDWSGIAPEANIVSVRVVNDKGIARMSTVIKGIQWVVQNRKTYGIDIVNISLGAPATGSYKNDPLAAAVEIAWHAGLVVVVSAGNQGPAAGTVSTPGYDPYVVTVGAVDMNATEKRGDDVISWFSSRGPTNDGLAKPDVVAPGRKMVSTRVPKSYLDRLLPDRVVDKSYFRLTGTSQAAAVVSGVAALLLDKNPRLTPDDVKARLMSSATSITGFDANSAGAGYVDASRAVEGDIAKRKQSARPADSLAVLVLPWIKGKSPLVWKDLSFNGGVDSRGIRWGNITWDNITWDNITWDNITWDNITWDNVTWDNITWDNITWDNVTWDNVTWDNVTWDNITWDTVGRLD
ncbi:MAG: S8 family peptidase [Chloroflexi bacterium]|nr:S8 family peptidase [Chloroflexota bacterium]